MSKREDILAHCPKGGKCDVSAPRTPSQCHFCWLATFDPDYGGTRPASTVPGLVSWRDRMPLPCRHLGPETGAEEPCACGGGDQTRTIRLRACSLHGACHETQLPKNGHCCNGCSDRQTTPLLSAERKILLTGGIGDAIALEAMMTPEDRERLTTIYYACPNWPRISELFQALPNFPKLKNHIALPSGRNVYYTKEAVEQALGLLPSGVEDWSIQKIFPQGRPYLGSSLLAHRLATPRTIDRPYVVIVPSSQSFGRWADRDFDANDWTECLAWLEQTNLLGVVLGGESSPLQNHPNLMGLQTATSVCESVELLKGAMGYLGIDSWLSVLAAKLFPVNRLAIKSTWDHCYANAATYYAPLREFRFVQRQMLPPVETPIVLDPREITVRTAQGLGDTFWVYQKLAPHYDRIHFQILVPDGQEGKLPTRALDWLRLLPRVANASTRAVSSEQYARIAQSKPALPRGGGTHSYAVNGWLEAGTRLDEIDPDGIEETVSLPVVATDIAGEYTCLYVSASSQSEHVRNLGVWTLEQWGAFVPQFLDVVGLRKLVIIGAGYDGDSAYAMAGRLREYDPIVLLDLPPAKVLGVLQGSGWFVGYQSGLNVLADQLDCRQLMLYFPALKRMTGTWAKRKNLGTRYFADVFREPEEVLRGFRDALRRSQGSDHAGGGSPREPVATPPVASVGGDRGSGSAGRWDGAISGTGDP